MNENLSDFSKKLKRKWLLFSNSNFLIIDLLRFQTINYMIELRDPGCREIGMFKGTECVTLSDPPMKACNAKFTTVPWKAFSDQVWIFMFIIQKTIYIIDQIKDSRVMLCIGHRLF